MVHSCRLIEGSNPLGTISARVGARISDLQQPDLEICDTYLVNVSERTMKTKIVGVGREEVTSKSLVLAPLIDWSSVKGALFSQAYYAPPSAHHISR